ncbi:MAG: thioredoxin domain-containing protein [Gallionellaceae bacterium]|nr:thioredoxin domain-containing protein [Gallionellaceae bacterium]
MRDPVHIVCPHCDAVSPVPADKLEAQPACDKCRQPLFSAHPVDLNGQNFMLHISSNDIPVLVDFWEPSCGPCRMMAPAYARAAQRLEPGLRVAKLNMEEERQIAEQFAIEFIPTLVLFKGGKEVGRKFGAMDAALIEAWVKTKT